MSTGNQEILSEFYLAIRRELISKLRESRLAPIMKDVGKNSGAGFTDLGVVSGFKDQDFVYRFGSSLDKVSDSDLAALILYLPMQESLVMALGKLAEHVEAAPKGKTGLPYFDEWQPADDAPIEQVPLVWSIGDQEEPRRLLEEGYRIGKSQPSGGGSSGFFVTILVTRDKS